MDGWCRWFDNQYITFRSLLYALHFGLSQATTVPPVQTNLLPLMSSHPISLHHTSNCSPKFWQKPPIVRSHKDLFHHVSKLCRSVGYLQKQSLVPNQFSSYCPISNLTILHNLVKRFVQSRLRPHISSINILLKITTLY